ncbi:Polyketide synthase, enoylreductase [Desulfovibrio sp. X2]|uniref:zinc-binding dehydrogenase n=1 Tax=Desulfovibrio sp. X2 TaxID=941449 RepID=UPI000358DB5A|nr:zinc-binding dehydrogenase [Desulfovibrio sp. X2]EPR41417.1 Polyketide synthase, enoylreductase [Desulfovibrio sp. X2]
MRYVHADSETPGTFSLREASEPLAGPSAALVAVKVFSLNPGEIRHAQAGALPRPGWDLAGEVIMPAGDGSSPEIGTRVVGFLPSGSWAERVSVPGRSLAAIPDGVSLEEAACLPVAGLTALNMLHRAGQIVGARVLVNGASGSVGYFSCALARLSGAHVVGALRNADRVDFARQAGAHEVVVSEDLSETAARGPYDVIVDTVGGKGMERAVQQLAAEGLYISCMTRGAVTLDDPGYLLAHNARIEIYGGLRETRRTPPGDGLARLLACVADKRLEVPIEERYGWESVVMACERLMARKVRGKIVLTIGS